MNQMSHYHLTFKSDEPAGRGHDFYVNAVPQRPGLLARIAGRISRHLAARRTLRAFDNLSQEQLKDIGYRRIPEGYTRYERLP